MRARDSPDPWGLPATKETPSWSEGGAGEPASFCLENSEKRKSYCARV